MGDCGLFGLLFCLVDFVGVVCLLVGWVWVWGMGVDGCFAWVGVGSLDMA